MTDWRATARRIAEEEGVHPDLFEKLVGAESSFNPAARSKAGAIGLAQLMPGTAGDLGVDPNDPEQNLRGGARYLKQMQDKFRSTPMALAAYNAGPGRVSRAGGVPNIAETEAYVAKINAQDDDSDIFGDTPAVPPAAAEPAEPSIRRGADGTIEIDINKGAGDPHPSYGDDADIFADGPDSAGASPIEPPIAAVAGSNPHSDEVLGFIKGAFKPLDNAAVAVETGLEKLGLPTKRIAQMLGSQTAGEAVASRKAAVDEQAAEGVVPGKIGEFAGNVLGTLPTAMLPGGVLAQGAAGGALLSDQKDAAGIVTDAAVGAAGGKMGELALGGASRLIAPKVRPVIQALRDAGVSLTPGQIAGGAARSVEDKLQSLPILGDAIRGARQRGIDSFNRAAVNRTLEPIGAALPKDVATGHQAVKFAEDALGDAYDALLPGLSVTPDAQLAAGLKSLGPQIQTLPAARQKQLKTILDQAVTKLGKTGPIGGKDFKAVESDLNTFVRRYSATADGDQQAMASVVADFRDELRDMLIRQNPPAAEQLKAINRGYANLVRVQDAAGRSAAVEGVFSPSGLNASVRAGASGVRKKSMSKGEALMQDLSTAGKAVLPDTVPDSGTAGRLLGAGGVVGLAAGGMLPQAAMGAGGLTIGAGLYAKPVQKILEELLAGNRPAAAKAVAKQLPKLKRPAVAVGSAAAVGARK